MYVCEGFLPSWDKIHSSAEHWKASVDCLVYGLSPLLLIFVSLFNWLFFFFLLLFPITPLANACPPTYFSLFRPLFSHHLPSLYLPLFFTHPLFRNACVCLKCSVPPTSSSLRLSHTWSGRWRHGEPSLDVGEPQMSWPLWFTILST